MKFTLRGASGVAILAGLAGSLPVWAQQSQTVTTATSGPQVGPAAQVDQAAPQQADDPQEGERVVVTGSFIQGTPEDAALPVEVYTAEDLEEQGAPTALEFAKSLSIAGPTTGEAYYFSGAALTGSVQYNLRGIGADKTLTLLNGRRMSENTSNIPSAALARTEILKDGAAVIYGADATGGVVNFITRDDFVGFETKGQYKYVDGSDGDYGLSLLAGFGEGDSNFLFSAEWEHRSRLESEERDFSSQPYWVNPAPVSNLTNMTVWLPHGALPALPTNTLTGEFGAAVNATSATALGWVPDFTQAQCNAVGGIYVAAAAGSHSCNYNYASYYNIVEENDIYRLFAQLNTSVTDNMDLHVEASYGQVYSPAVYGSPAQPVIRGPARATGATHQFYIPLSNPHAAAFAARSGYTTDPQFPITSGFTALTYRAFAHGGNPLWANRYGGYGTPSKIDNQIWRVNAAVNGTMGEMFGAFQDVGYDFSVTYNQSISYGNAADVLGYRLQEAMNGFGGPACNVPDLDPLRFGTQNAPLAGTGACMWWNPFATSFPNQPELGLTNPQYVPGTENPLGLIDWIFDPREGEDINHSLTMDLVFNAETPIALPGGNIGTAIGGQWRQIETRENVPSDLYNGNLDCDWPQQFTTNVGGAPQAQIPVATTDPRFTGCTPDLAGPFVFFGTNPPDYTDQQNYSIFGEFSIPVLDTLNLQAAVRREEFSGGLGATVYKVSGKWDVFGPLSIRGAYGTNYQAPPAGLVPGEINNGVNSFTRTGGLWLGAQTVTQSGIAPETATVWNTGVIWDSQGFGSDHNFRIIVDYFDIQTEDELGLLASANQITDGVFRYGATAAGVAAPTEAMAFATQQGVTKTGFTALNNNTAFADCSHPLISRVTLNGGPCVQGTTQVSALNSIRTDFGNGPGQHTTGIDIQVDYTLPFGPGDLSIGATATNTTEFTFSPISLDGFQLSNGDDRLGTLNFATIANAASEWRANGNINYNLDAHNVRLVANYISGVFDERFPTGIATAAPGAITGVSWGGSTYGIDGKDWLSFDLHYVFDITDTLRFNASVVNLTDRNPPASRQELGYDPRIGSPLGRTIELGLKKVF
jgi:iron complex outermembrane receptor protein